jgi:hypothetical protein
MNLICPQCTRTARHHLGKSKLVLKCDGKTKMMASSMIEMGETSSESSEGGNLKFAEGGDLLQDPPVPSAISTITNAIAGIFGVGTSNQSDSHESAATPASAVELGAEGEAHQEHKQSHRGKHGGKHGHKHHTKHRHHEKEKRKEKETENGKHKRRHKHAQITKHAEEASSTGSSNMQQADTQTDKHEALPQKIRGVAGIIPLTWSICESKVCSRVLGSCIGSL